MVLNLLNGMTWDMLELNNIELEPEFLELNNKTSRDIDFMLSRGYEITGEEANTKRLYNKVNIVPEKRLEQPLNAIASIVNEYLEFIQTIAPSNPPTSRIRLYSKTTGSDTKMYVKDSSGLELELASTSFSAASLDSAYNNGSVISVDTTDVDWRLSAGVNFKISNNSGLTQYVDIVNTGITLGLNTVITADLQVDNNVILGSSSADTITANGIFTQAGIYIRDTELRIFSSIDGQLDLTSDTNVTIGDGGATDYTSFGIDGTLTLIGTARVTKKNTLQLNSMTVDISGTPAIIAYGAGDPVLEINNGVTSIKCVASLSVGKYFGTSFDIPLDYDENGKIVVLLKKVATGQVETMSGSYLINKVGQAPDLVSTSFVTQTLDDSDTNLQEIDRKSVV